MRIVVIGAGILGAATAVELLRDNHDVTLLDPGQPGADQSASFGNGCWLSPQSVIPPAGPGLWRQVPRFLRDPLGPLAIRWRHLPRATPWLARYLLSGATEPRVRRTAAALRPLLRDGPALHRVLAAEAGVPHLVHHRGLMYIYPGRAAFEAESMAWRIRRDLGIAWHELDADALHQQEPTLDRRYTFGVLVDEGGHCTDPGALTAALAALAVSRGATLRHTRATGFRIEHGRLRAVQTEHGDVLADRAVLAAGAHARPLARQAGDDVPLESERGYHAVITDPEVRPRTPMMPSDGKMSVTLTETGLRCAGQVEIAGLDAAPNWQRAAILRDHLLRTFPGLPRNLSAERVRVWMGHRPSTPDGLPVIGPARHTPDIVHAFGHGHVGLVAAPRTARLVAQLVAGRPPELDLAPYSPARFRRRPRTTRPGTTRPSTPRPGHAP